MPLPSPQWHLLHLLHPPPRISAGQTHPTPRHLPSPLFSACPRSTQTDPLLSGTAVFWAPVRHPWSKDKTAQCSSEPCNPKALMRSLPRHGAQQSRAISATGKSLRHHRSPGAAEEQSSAAEQRRGAGGALLRTACGKPGVPALKVVWKEQRRKCGRQDSGTLG